MLERNPHPTDGRQVNLELTAKGATLRKGVGDAKRTWLAQVITQLDEHDRDTLFAAGKIIERLLQERPTIGDERAT